MDRLILCPVFIMLFWLLWKIEESYTIVLKELMFSSVDLTKSRNSITENQVIWYSNVEERKASKYMCTQ